jgi:hypothetical protein
VKAAKKCLNRNCDEAVNKGQHFCSLHIIVPKQETSDERNKRIGQEKQMAESLRKAKENEPKYLKKQKDGMEARDKEIAQAIEIAEHIYNEAQRIANLVIGFRATYPNTNAGSNGTLGGTDNPVTFRNLEWGKLRAFDVTPYIRGFDNSISGTTKIRIKHDGFQDVLIHLSL